MFRHQFLFEPLTSHAWNQVRTQKVFNPKNHGIHLYKKSGNQRIENHELKEHNGQIIDQVILQPTETNSTTWSARPNELIGLDCQRWSNDHIPRETIHLPTSQRPDLPDPVETLKATTSTQDPTGCTHIPSGTIDLPQQLKGPKLRKRGRRAGLQTRAKERGFKSPLPTILLANIQSIENKLDEIKSRLSVQRELRDCCVLCFTETWLTRATPDCTLQPEGFSIHRMDRSPAMGKARGGGVCLLINTSWCSDVVNLVSYCSLHLEYLMVKCCPPCLPQEFTSAIIIAVYIPPDAEVKNALHEIYITTNSLEMEYPEALFIVIGDFNQANLTNVLPKYHQHITCPTRGPDILDHCYTTIKDAYRSIPRQYFGMSDRNAVLLLPTCK
ncbi:uncharacterized protein LOC132825498 [Hemiscyllium ocellatum]|uniref:uncharacterized protein LOC132825498 n=1 Tax=Hemiscyllium ocellatum TaxID=170820 RepID=UPI002966F094|nr:uncharacterized protein LOC132825498 [Hemiscyllium ocellatum]XP_060696812.1 uncharacterized protein LOC132825498 [Hemiscyllium ocellatum]XP_060696813.1 uncharacterized protein LOC132825498 [Hemiscyllium ocellatum]